MRQVFWECDIIPVPLSPPSFPPRARIRRENGHGTAFWHGIRHAKGCLPGKPQVAQIGQAGAARFRADSVPELGLLARNRERADMEGCGLRKALGLRCDSVRGGVAKVTISPSFCHSLSSLFRRRTMARNARIRKGCPDTAGSPSK